MTADREPLYSREPKEQTLRVHGVDGITFIVFEHHIEGSGWQGRSFGFLSQEIGIMKDLLGQLPQIATQTPQENKLKIKASEDKTINFDVRQHQGWIKTVDDTKRRYASLATANIERLIHVLDELDRLNKGNDPHGFHFCDDYGVQDDD